MDKVNIQIQRQVSKPGQAENNQAISTIRPRLHQAFGLISQYACYRCCVCVINRTAAILLDKWQNTNFHCRNFKHFLPMEDKGRAGMAIKCCSTFVRLPSRKRHPIRRRLLVESSERKDNILQILMYQELNRYNIWEVWYSLELG